MLHLPHEGTHIKPSTTRSMAPQFPKREATESIIAFSINRVSGRTEIYKKFRDQREENILFDAVQYVLQNHWASMEETKPCGIDAA